MCTVNCIRFVQAALTESEISGKRVLEVGSYNVNGTTRPYLEGLHPTEYVGVDIMDGPGVDLVCDAEDLEKQFGRDSFDVVLTTEMLEHVRDWRTVITNLKRVLRPGGLLVITTRSPGFPMHGYPYDFWRYEPSDMEAIFADFESVEVESDLPGDPGVFVRARKGNTAVPEVGLDKFALHSVLYRRRAHQVSEARFRAVQVAWALWRPVKGLLPVSVKNGIRSKVSQPARR